MQIDRFQKFARMEPVRNLSFKRVPFGPILPLSQTTNDEGGSNHKKHGVIEPWNFPKQN